MSQKDEALFQRIIARARWIKENFGPGIYPFDLPDIVRDNVFHKARIHLNGQGISLHKGNVSYQLVVQI